MKIGRYEFGYWFLFIALTAPIILILKIFPDIPEWVVITTGTFFIMGVERLYSVWFLRGICENHLHPFITRHTLIYQIKGVLQPSAHIQGTLHNLPVNIEIISVMKNQGTWINCYVVNAQERNFKLFKRGFLGRLFQTGKTDIDPEFDNLFRLKPADCEVFLVASLRTRLSRIQSSLDVIDIMTLKKNKVALFYKGLLTDEDKLEAAIEAVVLIANIVQ